MITKLPIRGGKANACIDCGVRTSGWRCRPCSVSWRPGHTAGRIRAKGKARCLSPVEAAWLGAMVEGEGNIHIRSPKGTFWNISLTVVSSEIETIATCLRLSGIGTVRRVKPHGRNSKEHYWSWRSGCWNDVLQVLWQIKPYLTSKGNLVDAAASASIKSSAVRAHPLTDRVVAIVEEELARKGLAA